MHGILLHFDQVVEQTEIHPRHTVVIYEYAVAKALVPFDFIACVRVLCLYIASGSCIYTCSSETALCMYM